MSMPIIESHSIYIELAPSKITKFVTILPNFIRKSGVHSLNLKIEIKSDLVTTYGLNENMYSEISPVQITMEELFA